MRTHLHSTLTYHFVYSNVQHMSYHMLGGCTHFHLQYMLCTRMISHLHTDHFVYSNMLHRTYHMLGGGAWARTYTTHWWACDAAAGDAGACAKANASAPLLVAPGDFAAAPRGAGRRLLAGGGGGPAPQQLI